MLIHEVLSPEAEHRLSRLADSAQTARVVAHHSTPEGAGGVFARVQPRLAVYTHIVPSPAGEADLVPATRKVYRGRLAVGYDLMLVTIGSDVTVGRRETRPDR